MSAMHKVTGNVTAVSEQSFSHAAKEPTSRDTAIASEIWGKHGSKTSGRIEMFLKLGRGISKKGSFLSIGTNETEEAESSG